MIFLTLDGAMRWTFLFHAACGTLALLVFTIPFFSRKGGRLHTRSGWIYVAAMALVCVSAFAITPWRAFLDPSRTQSSQTFAAFLFFIAVFTLCSVYFGLAVLRAKDRTGPSSSWAHLGPPTVLAFLGLGTQLLGMRLGDPLLVAFPFLAHLTARSHLMYWKRSPDSRRHWWYAHMSGMGAACIATVTAFLVSALPRLWPHPLASAPLVWVAPGLIGGMLLRRAVARERARFGEAGQ